MWYSAARVKRSQIVDAAPERVWSLLGSSAAWSLGPAAGFAFDVPDSLPDTGRLFVSLGTDPDGLGILLYEVRDEQPGKTISVHDRDPRPTGKCAFTLSAASSRHGVRAEVAVGTAYPRDSKLDGEIWWGKTLRRWLDALRDVVEDRAPWPGSEMPPEVLAAFMQWPSVNDPLVVSAEAHIAAPADVVWRARSAEPASAGTAAVKGHVPGTPKDAAEQMLYKVVVRPDGQLQLVVSLVKEVVHERRVRSQRIGAPYDEMTWVLEPDAGGTRVELTIHWPVPTRQTDIERHRESLTAALQARALRWKAASEEQA